MSGICWRMSHILPLKTLHFCKLHKIIKIKENALHFTKLCSVGTSRLPSGICLTNLLFMWECIQITVCISPDTEVFDALFHRIVWKWKYFRIKGTLLSNQGFPIPLLLEDKMLLGDKEEAGYESAEEIFLPLHLSERPCFPLLVMWSNSDCLRS